MQAGDPARHVAALTQKLLLLWSTEELGEDQGLPQRERRAPAQTPSTAACCDMTPSTSFSSCSPRRRQRSSESSYYSLDEAECERSAEQQPPLATDSQGCGRLSASAVSAERQAAQAAQQQPGCLAGCMPWLFGASARYRRPDGRVDYRLERLEHVGLLGCGSFGSVTLVRCCTTGQSLALKAVSKGLVAQRQLKHTLLNEKAVLRRCQSPFVVQLAATFSRGEHLYFLMEAVLGGDLYTIYARRSLFSADRYARFYTACIVKGLEHLHGRDVIYRDLKLENVVVDARGYAKLCDFGFARCLDPADGRAYTVCGTPECMAPEVVLGFGYTRAADWWSLGVLVYEMMVSDTPFAAEDLSMVRVNAAKGLQGVQMPIGAPWASLVRGLCRLEPSLRLAVLPGGVRNVERQAWFCEAGFDWDALSRRSMEAPYVPHLTGPKDLSNFSTGDQVPPPEVPYKDTGTGWDVDFEDSVGPWIREA